MNAMDLLDILGDVEDRYIEEAAQPRKRPWRSKARVLLIAALVAALLAGCTYAVMKMQDLKIGQIVQPPAILWAGETAPTEPPQDVISLQGYAGSPNYLAAQEWFAFTENYDPDNKLKNTVEASLFRAPEAYSSYNCYTQEMVDKVEEICRKYDLEPMGKLWQDDDTEYICKALGIEGITSQYEGLDVQTDYGFYFADGSFHFSGEIGGVAEPDSGRVFFDFNSLKKTSFANGTTTVNSIEDYRQWEYTTAQGVKALLALSPGRGLILVDREDEFVSVSVVPAFYDFDAPPIVDKGAMERIADSFDFTYQTKEVDKEAAEARWREWMEKM